MSKMKPEEKSCYTCKHSFTTKDPAGCYCDLDDHYIGYIVSMSCSCEKWEAKDGKQTPTE